MSKWAGLSKDWAGSKSRFFSFSACFLWGGGRTRKKIAPENPPGLAENPGTISRRVLFLRFCMSLGGHFAPSILNESHGSM